MGGIAVVLFLALVLSMALPFSYAAPLPKDNLTIGIQLSRSCITMIQANMTTSCPSYEDLYKLGLDDSIYGTGDFEFDENGYFHRGPSQYKNVHELYRYDDYHIILDPPALIASRAKIIIINPDLPVYIPIGEYVKVNHQRVLAHDRYVEDCHTATITSKNWSDLLADTVFYLRNGCTKTVFDTREIIQDHITEMDFTTSAKYKHDMWVKESIEKCKTQICKEY